MKKFLEETPCKLCRSDYRARHGIVHLEKSADERVETEAMMIVGRACMDGELVHRDELLALDWFVRAANEGHSTALSYLAYQCYGGRFLERNASHAERLANAAAKKGCAKVHNLLGVIYWKEFKADPHGAMQTKFLDHWKFAAAAGCQESLDNTKEFGVDMHGIISEEEFDGVREECEEALTIEWTEDREEWSKDR